MKTVGFAYSRTGLALLAITFLGGAYLLLSEAKKRLDEETAFYSGSVPATARIVSSELGSARRGGVRWTIAYEFAAGSQANQLGRGPTRLYQEAIDTTKKPGDAVAIRYRPDNPAQNALETGGPVLWDAYVIGACGLVAFAFAAVFGVLATVRL
jgi:hypothetical protein